MAPSCCELTLNTEAISWLMGTRERKTVTGKVDRGVGISHFPKQDAIIANTNKKWFLPSRSFPL